MIRPILKWMGGKTRVLPELLKVLPEADYFVEPFVGAGSVFLNTTYPNYILSDTNPDLIGLLTIARDRPEALIVEAKAMFKDGENRCKYMERRDEFNSRGVTGKPNLKDAATFLYLTRHGYNGLCRYNQSGGFNVPYGAHPNGVYFPEEEILAWAKRCSEANVELLCADFRQVLNNCPSNSVIYADPPYIPLSDTSKHAQYHKKEFSQADHRELAKLLLQQAADGNKVVLSNADTLLTRDIYYGFKWREIQVGRYMSADASKRKSVGELIGTL
ncbi:DNA adenine methylase [Salmonella phage SPAsTU]|nr:DNA adenine methylase [Salmonella phage SPAsTU]